MNKIFLSLLNKGKNTAKYVIFSVIFVFALILGFGEVAQIKAADSIFKAFPSGTAGTAPDIEANNKNISGADALTTINGTLSHGCVHTTSATNFFGYTINKTSYSDTKGTSPCMTYTSGTSKEFYVQATDDPSSSNTITFTINADDKYNYITIFEQDFTASAGEDENYDLYYLNGTDYVYELQYGGATAPSMAHSITVSGSGTNIQFKIEYQLRDSTYNQKHLLSVYFYDAEPDTAVDTKRAEIIYTLAKPINDYDTAAEQYYYNGVQSSAACGGDKVCVMYYTDSGATVSNVHTKKFNVKVPEHVAMYFSTINTHNSGSVTTGDVEKFNSIYAVNTFQNQGESSNIVFYYFNVKDNTTYDYAVTVEDVAASPNLDYYDFTLTIDASGTYKFYIIDIFGNKQEFTNEALKIEDVANRTLKIYYIKYGNNFASNGNDFSYGEVNEGFELGDDLGALTNENVEIGLEFYFSVVINSDYGTQLSGSASIKLNPLYYNDETNKSQQIKMADGREDTYYCRLSDPDAYNCVDSGKGSNYLLRQLRKLGDPATGQIIAADSTTGLNAVTNDFDFVDGILTRLDPTHSIFATGVKPNRVNVEVNENGRFFVRVEDTLDNNHSSTIDVSIIDQLNPVITVNKGASTVELTNTICSSMYVIGAANADGVIQGYPTDALVPSPGYSPCDKVAVEYNHFNYVDANAGGTVTITRKNNNKYSGVVDTNGFYDAGTTAVSFNYADAIRIALLRVSDSITAYDATSIEKSYYQVKDGNTYYTEYELYSQNVTGSSAALLAPGYADNDRINFKNDYIISNKFLQYSSELKYYNNISTALEMVTFDVFLVDTNGYLTSKVCGYVKDDTSCYDIVNTYIDKSISFAMQFKAVDYVGNESNTPVVKVDVIDDTTPGIASIDGDSAFTTDPTIYGNNMPTKCRLEIGSIIQNRQQLLECYGFKTEGADGAYHFVDNATTYEVLGADYASKKYYNNVLYEQLYKKTGYNSQNNSIKVYVCKLVVANDGDSISCNDTDKPWTEVTDAPSGSDFIFDNAGTYGIKFVISDTGLDYTGGTATKYNTTTIIGSYYVNPRILLIRPVAKEKTYGQAADPIDYCVYATKNTLAFHHNLFNIVSGNADGYTSTYDFVAKNYESSANGLVYCTNDALAETADTPASKLDLQGILATTNANIQFTGALSRTYATGKNKYYMEFSSDATGGYGNIYEDAGYYYITLGDLAITVAGETDTDKIAIIKNNYVIRLHPSYLLDGEIPHTAIKNYDEIDEDHYKYTVTGNTNNNATSHGETISNVLYTIKQGKLEVSANGGSKEYSNPDTNYSQAKVTTVSNNATGYTNITGYAADGTMTNATAAGSVRGYLGGFAVSGFVNLSPTPSSGYMSLVDDFGDKDSILQGYLRRQSGEEVGRYYICNSNVNIVGNSISADSPCNITPSINTLQTEVTLSVGASGNVYTLVGNTYTHVNSGDIEYGMYFKGATDTVYYKLTRNNTTVDGSGKIATFKDYHNSKLWQFNYDDTDYSLKVLPNAHNENQNYYIDYTTQFYIITPRQLIVQPGANQGKEYSNPTHNDPIYEIVVYGENLSVTGTNDTDFNDQSKAVAGYTEDIANITDPSVPTKDSYTAASATGTTVERVADTELYFSQRRTKTADITGAQYVYKFDPITLDTDKRFSVDGVQYQYTEGDGTNPDKICLVTVPDDCIANGGSIGVNTITVNSGQATVSWVGYLTYQTYALFTSDGTAGTGKISRENVYKSDSEVVGWYDYVFAYADLRSVNNSKAHCTVDTSNYSYTVATTGTLVNCANYEVVFTDNAPARSGDALAPIFTTTTTPQPYLHDGTNGYDSPVYSLAYDSTTKNIQFSIFKRDIIISFDAASETYGQVSGYFDQENKQFYIPTNQADKPSIITCYKKSASGKYEVDGVKYEAISESDCNSVDYGLSQGDKWGSDGLNLDFFLNETITTEFASDYAVPAGLYYVYASIGTGTPKVHPNYKLIYINYNVIQAAIADGAKNLDNTNVNPKNGALEITSKEVTLTGTYYQKEFGQAVYATYGANGEALQVVTAGTQVRGEYSTKLANTKIIQIFDNHYYSCESTSSTYNGQSIAYGCNIIDADYSDNKYKFNNTGNIYLYTFADGDIINLTTSGSVDEIAANFAGAPVRARPSNAVAEDKYGLLDDAGFYVIDMAAITPVIATYTWLRDDLAVDIFDVSNGTIYRYTNYDLPDSNKIDGGLYITPAQITITVTDGQKKMYGCAYNTVDTDVSDSTYVHGTGYENCIETFAQNYDLGYQYTVTGDKAEYLKRVTTTYSNFNACGTMSDRIAATSCNDITYSSLSYTVTPNYTTTADGNTSDPSNGKPTHTSLNDGTLYRMYSGADSNVTYSYNTYFGYGVNAKQVSGTKYQQQQVGNYAITLGNLDAAFNDNAHCGVDSMPVDGGSGTSQCKNFIVNYGGNNTSTHVNKDVSGNRVDDFDTSANFVLTVADFDFTITTRNVVITTEYNYKVHGDTEPNEGYRCSDLKNIFSYTSGKGTDFAYGGRSYCNNDADFILTGVARFYALDNSLAKAPWTAWVDHNESSYSLYNDTLYDVIDYDDSKINRRDESGGTNPQKGDAVGRYQYDYVLSLNTTYDAFTGSNYVINYLTYTVTSTSITTTEPSQSSGFAITRTSENTLISLDRWYKDANHLCLGESDGSNTSCSYTGDETFNFAINGIDNVNNTDRSQNNSYSVTITDGATTQTLTSGLVENVYFEIVRREIFVVTEAVSKDYGIEEKYTDFNVKLCSEYSSGSCTPIQKTTSWGVRNSLSKEDYERFYPSGTFSQAAFKGSNQDAGIFRGATTSGAFGIYFYRTPGENVGSYVIVACPTQISATDEACRTYYKSDTAADTEDERLTVIPSFYAITPNNERNASNYIVKTVASQITINQRKVHITPDEGQGFQYGNYVAGTQIAPITFTEKYTSGATEYKGLVNGGLIFNTDTVDDQIALCIYDISQIVTCINDRQNSSGATGTSIGYATTGLHVANGTVPFTKAQIDAIDLKYPGTDIVPLGYNVYNDDYTEDNDTSRFALSREMVSGTDARYNRNVGEYTIVAKELSSSAANCSAVGDKNCLNANYDIDGFTEGVKYTITAAVITVTPSDDQNKTYGQSDVHLAFTVSTTFTAARPNDDQYYCGTGSHCQTITGVQTLVGFAYGENDASDASHNYGVAKNGIKAAEEAQNSIFTSDSADNPKYYDKYCLGSPVDCELYSAASTHEYASLKYGSTSRILLGYFYVEEWKQSANSAHKILNGIIVAKNEFDNENYTYNVALGEDTAKTFEIKKLKINATISDIIKTYGQSTDSHKCDDATGCSENFATLNANDNENRLEYNFNVVSVDGSGSDIDIANSESSVNIVSNKVLLTRKIGNYYYTQTSLAEYKNIHLGLTVVRKNNNANVCISTLDKYGCEDVGSYTLVFRKQSVTNNVDNNYDVLFGGNEADVKNDIKGYVIVDSANSAGYNQQDGETGSDGTAVTYTIYKDSGLDTVPAAQTSGAADTALTEISIIDAAVYSSTLTINQRSVVFYIGTYNSDGSVSQRYVIEQNEQVPRFPALNAPFTTSITDPRSKQVHYVTWFDGTEYSSVGPVGVPRQVRTTDKLVGADAYGVLICKQATNNVQGETFNAGNCTSTLPYAEVNNIGADGKYKFDTSNIGDYAIIRNPEATYIQTGDSSADATKNKENETRNYNVSDVNGVLVIYEDQTDPVIQIGNSIFAIEANADSVDTDNCTVSNTAGNTFYYDCEVTGKTFDETTSKEDRLGSIIKYLTMNYSNYMGTNSSKADPDDWGLTTAQKEALLKLPTTLAGNVFDGWFYYPVNNIGITSSSVDTTLYSVDRTANTYSFINGTAADTVIASNLEAISSIISWFNVTSYDYSYFRGDDFDGSVVKRYTPRYYIYIEGVPGINSGNFDPTYVGDFKVKIYAMDDVGNISDPVEVTLSIVDKTKPKTGEMHLFNAPVVCLAGGATEATVSNCMTNTIGDWYVKSGYVSIDAFRKYKLVSGSSYVEDNVNGTFIKLNGNYVNIYSTSISRYMNSGDTTTNILGNYVKVNAKETAAVEVEHVQWSNIRDKYLVIVGGEDNSYIDPEYNDANSQWHTYYSIDGGTKWYKYSRHDYDGVKLSLKDGITTLITRVLDTGRYYTVDNDGNSYVYYKNVYLKNLDEGVAADQACNGITGCNVISDGSGVLEITQVQAVQGSDQGDGSYVFKIHSIDVKFVRDTAAASVAGTASWPGTSNVTVTDGEFKFGIMQCTIDVTKTPWEVSCVSDYARVYKTSDKVTTTTPTYTITNSYNIGDWDDGNWTGTVLGEFYKDRRYIFIDTQAPTLTLNGQKYSVYEYDEKCKVLVSGEDADDICESSYDEKFLSADDSVVSSSNTTSTLGETEVTTLTTYLTTEKATDYTNIAWYTLYNDGTNDQKYKVTVPTATTSGLLEDGSAATPEDIMGGASTLNKADADAATFNKFRVDLSIYLSMQTATSKVWYRYIAIYDGSVYSVYRQKYTTSYEDLTAYNHTSKMTVPTGYPALDSIEDVLEFIVSTVSVDYTGSGIAATSPVLLTFSINYNIKDAAGNISADVSNQTIRGVTLTKLPSALVVNTAAAVNAGVALTKVGDNVYQVVVNQGVSLNSLLSGLTVTNIDINGRNNMESVRYTLYYNGQPVDGKINGIYTSDTLTDIQGYISAPGTYTLRLTSTRQVESQGKVYTVDDNPLEFNFVVEAPRNITNLDGDYSRVAAYGLAIAVFGVFLLGIGYLAIKKYKKQD